MYCTLNYKWWLRLQIIKKKQSIKFPDCRILPCQSINCNLIFQVFYYSLLEIKQFNWTTVLTYSLSITFRLSSKGKLTTVNDRKYVFHFRAETEYLAGKTSGLRPNTVTETECTNIVKIGGFCCSLTFLMSKVNEFFFKFW